MATHTSLRSLFSAIANAIRAKTDGSADIVADDFPTAIAAIPKGTTPTGTKQITITQNGTTTEDVASYASAEITTSVPDLLADNLAGAMSGTYENNDITVLRRGAFAYQPNLTKVICHNVGKNLGNTQRPNLTQMFAQSGVTSVAFPYFIPAAYRADSMGPVQVFDLIDEGNTYISYGIGAACFNNCTALNTLIIRSNAIYPLSNINAFGNTPFKSGGTGGTIYIPKSLYDHLGDGTSSDYKAASNWSTIDGYGTITWAKIEGSQYDGVYADGTTIPTT